MSVAPIRVLVADDQRVVRDGLATLLGLDDGIAVVGVAADGAEALEAVGRVAPDVVLMDLRMPVLDGVAATAALHAAGGPPVLVLTTFADDESLFPALRAGAKGYLTKDAGRDEIGRALRAVAAGGTWLDPAVHGRLVAALTGAGPASGPATTGPATPGAATSGPPTSGPAVPEGVPAGLTAREAEVLGLIAGGYSNGEIGAMLHLGQATIKTHVNRIFAKTGVRDRAQAVRFAYEHGLAGG